VAGPAPTDQVNLTDEESDLCRDAGLHIGRTEMPSVGQQRFGLAELLQQGAEAAQHRCDLMLAVGRLHHIIR